MDEDRRRVGRQSARAHGRQPVDLEARAAIALDAVGARDRDDDLGGIVRAHPGDIGGQRFPPGALGRVVVAKGRGAGQPGGGQELVAGFAVVGGEGLDVAHLNLTPSAA